MSLAARPPSPQERFVQTLQRTDSFSSTDSVEMRVEGYVRALKVNEEQLPKVKYSPLISISLSDVCRAATCCFQSKCCVSEQILVASPSKDGVVFHSQKPTEELSSDINQLTNASFFADLYRTHLDFLPYLMASAIAYLPSKELKEFWRNWDPKSSLPLDLNKAIMFRDLLNQAHQVMNEVRVQMMKQDMLNMFASAQTKNIQKIAQRSLISSREGTLHRPRMAHSHDFSDIEPAPSRIADVHQLSTRVKKMSLSSSASKSIHCKGEERPFDRERLIQDIQSISGCSKKKAGEIAWEVEEVIFEGCTTEELWEILRLKMEKFQVGVKCSIKDPFSREILKTAQRREALSVTDIPAEDFAKILKTKKSCKQRKFFRKKESGSEEKMKHVSFRLEPREELKEETNLIVTYV